MASPFCFILLIMYCTCCRFDQCAISSLSLKAVEDAGYERMTEVQEATLPIILQGQWKCNYYCFTLCYQYLVKSGRWHFNVLSLYRQGCSCKSKDRNWQNSCLFGITSCPSVSRFDVTSTNRITAVTLFSRYTIWLSFHLCFSFQLLRFSPHCLTNGISYGHL